MSYMLDASNVKKVAHLQILDPKHVVIQKLYQELDAHGKRVKYNAQKHFRIEQLSPLVEKRLESPYLEISINDPRMYRNILENGYFNGKILTPGSNKPVRWLSICAFWRPNSRRGSKGKMYLVPPGAHVPKDIRAFGLFVNMADIDECLKVSKYDNSLTSAPTPWAAHMFGVPTKFWDGDDGCRWAQYELDNGLEGEDRLFTVRFVDLKRIRPDGTPYTQEEKALMDGFLAAGPKALRKLNVLDRDGQLGDAFRVRFSMEEFAKGHLGVLPWLTDCDLVVYGPKSVLQDENFYFMSMGRLHAGIPHTDMQAIVNFGFWRTPEGEKDPFLVWLARKQLLQIWEDIKDENKLAQMFLRMNRDAATGEIDFDLEGWILRKAFAYRLSWERFPWILRRIVRHLLFKVNQFEQGRISMEGVADYGYVMPDPYAFHDPAGEIHIERCRIGAGELVFPGIEPGTEVVTYRQPSENSNAWWSFIVVHYREYDAFRRRGICLLGRDADLCLERLGGADLDDSFVICHDPKLVSMFDTLLPYPETDKISDEPVAETPFSEADMFGDDSLLPPLNTYNNHHALYQLQRSLDSGVGIGPVVNACMIDQVESDPVCQRSMIAKMLDRIDQAKRDGQADAAALLTECAEWLLDRPAFQMRILATNQERVIDGSVKDMRILEALGDVSQMIRDFHEKTRVYPSFAGPAFTPNRLRIPMYKLEMGDFVYQDSPIDECLRKVIGMRDKLIDHFKVEEWRAVGPADHEIDEFYPTSRELYKQARTVLGFWRSEWAALFDAGKQNEVGPEGESQYAILDSILADQMAGLDDMAQEALAVEIYRQVYRAEQHEVPLDDKGRRRSYGDGILGTPSIGAALINAFREAGWTGALVPVDLDPYWHDLLHKSVLIEVKDQIVYWSQDFEDDTARREHVGTPAHRMKDGRFKMVNGLIHYAEPAPALLKWEMYGG